MDEQEKRRWAVEQAIALHAKNGMATGPLLDEARKLLEFVEDKKTPPSRA